MRSSSKREKSCFVEWGCEHHIDSNKSKYRIICDFNCQGRNVQSYITVDMCCRLSLYSTGVWASLDSNSLESGLFQRETLSEFDLEKAIAFLSRIGSIPSECL